MENKAAAPLRKVLLKLSKPLVILVILLLWASSMVMTFNEESQPKENSNKVNTEKSVKIYS